MQVKGNATLARKHSHKDAMWLAATNVQVDEINNDMFKQLADRNKPYYRLWAVHRPAERASGAQRLSADEHANLLKRAKSRDDGIQKPSLELAVNTRVRCTHNLATQSGLYNGALGTVYSFVFPDGGPPSRLSTLDQAAKQAAAARGSAGGPIVLVQMDGGKNQDGSLWGYTGDTCMIGIPRLVPFCAVASRTKLNGKHYRWQLPIEPAHASTIHLAQGLTCKNGIVFMPPTGTGQAMGLAYVALSRAKSLAGICLLKGLTMAHFNGHAPTRALVRTEYTRLRGLNHPPQ